MRYQKVILLNYRFIFNQQHRIITVLLLCYRNYCLQPNH